MPFRYRWGRKRTANMGHMKNFDIRIRMGGDDAVAAACEVRREACRQWLMRQCELEAHRGTNIELRRLSKIYRDNFGGEYGDDSDYNRDLPPYEWADAMLLERRDVACEPTKPTLTNEERRAIMFAIEIFQVEGKNATFEQLTLRKLLKYTLERLLERTD